MVRGKHGHTHRLCEYASFHTIRYGRFRVNRARQQGAVFINTVQVAAGGQLVVAVLCTGSFSGHLAHPARRTRRVCLVRGGTVGSEVVPAHVLKP